MFVHAALRFFVFALAAALSTCNAPIHTSATPPAAPAPAAPRTVRVFDPDVVIVAADSPLAPVRAAIGRRAFAHAEALARDGRRTAQGDDRIRLAWLEGRAARDAGNPAGAVRAFAIVAASRHPLADWARLECAKLWIESEPNRAVDELAPLTTSSWAGRSEARELHASALVRAGRAAEAEPLLRALLAEAPADSARAPVAMPLADLLASKNEIAAKIEAVHLYRRVAMRAPLSRAARDAEARLAPLLAAIPVAQRRSIEQPSDAEAFARAEAIANAMQHTEAERAFVELIERTQDPALRCRARLGRGRAVYHQRERRRAAELLSEVANECEQPDVRAWSRYLAGKGFVSAGDPVRGLAEYTRLEAEVPDHRLADDARFRSALIDADRGDEAAMTERLRTLPERYPNGDMHGEARFMLAWRARRGGRLDEALTHLDASLAAGPGEDAEDVRGRTAYWRACVLAELGRLDQARAEWASVVRSLPLSYYAGQALAQLSATSAGAAEEARGSYGTRGDRRIVFGWRSELDAPDFQRALELMKVGAIDAARRELAAWQEGIADRSEELKWIEAALLDRAGAHPEAVGLARRELHGFLREPPSNDHFARWRIAYPRAYSPLIEDAANERAVPAELVRAIAREESSFRADAVSVAHAYGLVQVIVPTARRFGEPLGLRPNANTLIDPEVNVRVGAEYMRWLLARYAAHPGLLPSAYNAGQGATDRWLRERPGQRFDEWVEEIPYDETRRYTRRVLQTWGTYRWLDRGELLELPARVPTPTAR